MYYRGFREGLAEKGTPKGSGQPGLEVGVEWCEGPGVGTGTASRRAWTQQPSWWGENWLERRVDGTW